MRWAASRPGVRKTSGWFRLKSCDRNLGCQAGALSGLAGLTQGLQVSIRQSSRCEYLVDKPSHDTNLVGKIHRRGKGCVVGMGGCLGIIPTSRERGPSVTLAVAVLAF